MIIPSVIMKNKDGSSFGVDIFSRLLNDRIIFLNSSVNPETAGVVISEMLYLANVDKAPIHFYINSPGGDVIDGLSIIDTMKILNCPVYTYGVGTQASMGSLLLISGEKGHRQMFKNSFVMIHSISSGGQGKLPDLEESLKFTKHLNAIITQLYTNQTDIKAEELEKIFKSPDYWISSDEALRLGIVDSIIG